MSATTAGEPAPPDGGDGYRFELVTLSGEELVRTAALLKVVFPRAAHLTPDYLRWRYRENPDGRAVGCNAYSGGELVGHMVAEPMRATIEGREKRAIFLQNGAVHAAHRGRKLQSRISAALFEDAQRQGYDVAIGTGNRYSTGPLLTRFQLVRPLDARLGWGVPKQRDDALIPSFERLWSEEALRWRLANPHRSYAVRNGTLLAPTGWPGIAAILLARAGLPDTGRIRLGPLRLWLGLDPRIDWRRSPFVPIPAGLRPSPLNLVFRDLGRGIEMPDRGRFVFRAIDFDPF